MNTLAGRHALITGGGSGIGAAIAQALAGAGAAVSLAGRRLGPLQEVAAGLPRAAAIVADVTREADVEAMVAQARAAHGPIDIVVANAGAAESAPAGKIDMALWDRMLAVNLTGAFLTARAALPDVTRRGASGYEVTPQDEGGGGAETRRGPANLRLNIRVPFDEQSVSLRSLGRAAA